MRLPSGNHLTCPAPVASEHGREVLLELGLDDDAIDRLVEDGVVLA